MRVASPGGTRRAWTSISRATSATVRDALGRLVTTYDYDMLGSQIRQRSMDAGARRVLENAAGQPDSTVGTIWDTRSGRLTTRCQRPTAIGVAQGGQKVLLERLVYGETHPQQDRNLRTQLYRHYDGAGVVTNERFDFKGNLLEASRQLAKEYRKEPDWSALELLTDLQALENAARPDLEEEVYTHYTRYDALDRPIQEVTPHTPAMKPNVIQSTYNEANLLESTDVWVRRNGVPGDLLPASTADQHVVVDINYDARGQRTRIEYGNGVVTYYTYDPLTFRLLRIHSVRPPTFPPNARSVQDLNYVYDPVGNITRIRDDADIHNVIYFRNRRVDPSSDYEYDAVYRLVSATGREHLGQGPPVQVTHDESFRVNLPHPHDGNAMARYTETYEYDPVGNLLKMAHTTLTGSWTRYYAYEEPSLLEAGVVNNRLSATSLPGDGSAGPYRARYGYDVHGNMTSMPHLAGGVHGKNIYWNVEDQVHRIDHPQGGSVYYTYDSEGQRVRKVWEKASSIEERSYLGGFEMLLRRDGSGTFYQRESLHVTDDADRVDLVETRTLDLRGSDTSPPQLHRYQLDNHLESACVELDREARIISCEEYTPFGTTAYQAVSHPAQAPKRFRSTGKEKDHESGLYYHGARYYAAWLARWVSADPSGITSGLNLYEYVAGNPIAFNDPDGMRPRVPTMTGSRARPDLRSNEQRRAQARAKRRDKLRSRQRSIDSWRKARRDFLMKEIPKLAGQRPRTRLAPPNSAKGWLQRFDQAAGLSEAAGGGIDASRAKGDPGKLLRARGLLRRIAPLLGQKESLATTDLIIRAAESAFRSQGLYVAYSAVVTLREFDQSDPAFSNDLNLRNADHDLWIRSRLTKFPEIILQPVIETYNRIKGSPRGRKSIAQTGHPATPFTRINDYVQQRAIAKIKGRTFGEAQFRNVLKRRRQLDEAFRRDMWLRSQGIID